MGLQVLDGKGRGNLAEVDAENRMRVNAVTIAERHHVNESEGKCWTIPFEGLNPSGADMAVVYIKNTGDVDLEISTVRVSADTAITQVELQWVTGTAAGGAAIVPVSRKLGSGATPSATIESAVDITGLTNAGVLGFVQCAVVLTQYEIEFKSAIVMPKGTAVALVVESATANITGTISLYEELTL